MFLSSSAVLQQTTCAVVIFINVIGSVFVDIVSNVIIVIAVVAVTVAPVCMVTAATAGTLTCYCCCSRCSLAIDGTAAYDELLLRFILFLVELGAAVTAVTASTVATGDAPGTADAAVGGAIVERHLRSISLASFVKSI